MKAHTIKGTCKVSTQACVYMLIDPIKREPFYVGIGKLSRPHQHFKHENGNRFRWNVINKLRRAGIADETMLIYVATDLSAEVARCTEEWLVAVWGRRSEKKGPLTNLTPGGERNVMDDPVARKNWENATRDLEYRKRRREAISAASAKPESRARRSAFMTELYKDESFRERQREGAKAAAARPGARERLIVLMRENAKASVQRMTGAGNPMNDLKVRAKYDIAIKQCWADPAVREKRKGVALRLWQDAAYRDRTVAAIKASKTTPEARAHQSLLSSLQNSASRKQAGKKVKELWADPVMQKKWVDAFREAAQRPETKAKKKAMWSDPEYRAKQSAARKAAWADPKIRALRCKANKASANRPDVKAKKLAGLRATVARRRAEKELLS